jgi:uncharacterized protein (TIGR02266 family)
MSMKILLPADSEILDIVESSFLHRSGFTFITAKDGREAFLLIEEHDPALVVLDVDMKGLNGNECCRQIKQDSVLRNTPIIMIVPKEARNNEEQCRDLSCEAVVGRPIDPQRFLATASHLLGIFDRAAPRIETFLVISCGSDLDELHEGWIRNINSGGCFIETSQLLPINYRIAVQLALSEDEPLICCRARVAWVNHPEWVKSDRLPAGMGVQFLDLREDDAARIQAYIDAHIIRTQPGSNKGGFV